MKTSLAITFAAASLCSALTNGPSMPEYTQFEEVGATDLVNLNNGNFTWSLPVMTVPGPGLGFPIVLSYHSGIGQKEEASWVGLGWNLQAGSITRQVNKLPDDFKNVEILETVKSDKIHGWSFSVGYNGATVGISYHSLEGMGGFVGYNLLQTLNSPLSATMTMGFGSASRMSGMEMGLSAGYGIAMGKNFGIGVSASTSINLNADGASTSSNVGVGVSLAVQDPQHRGQSTQLSLVSMGVGLNSQGGLSAGGSVMGISNSISIQGNMQNRGMGFGVTIPTKIGVISLGYNNWSSWIEGIEKDHYYGFLYGDKSGMSCTDNPGSMNCHRNGTGGYLKRHEFVSADRPFVIGWGVDNNSRLSRTTEDSYIVNAQGISGVFQPHRQEDGDYMNTLDKTSKFTCSWDFWNRCGRRTADRTEQLEINRNLLNKLGRGELAVPGDNDIYWRFVDDAGGAEWTNPESRDERAFASEKSRQIKPLFDADGVLLQGFEIISSNGTRYVFGFPLWHGWERKTGFQEDDINKYTRQETKGKYAYAWLMTAILTPDYVDLGSAGFDKDDIGGWVKFTYGDGTGPSGENKTSAQYWGTPYHDPDHAFFSDPVALPNKNLAISAPAPQSNGVKVKDEVSYATSRSSAAGIKDIAYLHTIETSTHKAVFMTGSRADNYPFPGAYQSILDLPPGTWTATRTASTPYAVRFRINGGFDLSPGLASTRINNGDVVSVKLDYYFSQPGVASVPYTCKISEYMVGTDNTSCVWQGNMPDAVFKANEIEVQLPSAARMNKSKVLGSITLLDKEAIEATPADDGSPTSPHRGISHVEFNTDYTLAPGTPNSYAYGTHAKLTLKSVVFRPSQMAPPLPPYTFSYGNNQPFQGSTSTGSGIEPWVPWEKGLWDRWGNLCHACSDSYHEPDPPFYNNQFHAGAWNLERITLPSGAELSVEYGARNYHYVGSQPFSVNHGGGTYEILVASGGVDVMRETLENNEHFVYRIGIDAIRYKLARKGLHVVSFRLVANINRGVEAIFVGESKSEVVTQLVTAWADNPFRYQLCNIEPKLVCTAPNGSVIGINGTFSRNIIYDDELWLSFVRQNPGSVLEPVAHEILADYQLFVEVDPLPGLEKYAEEDYANGAVATRVSLREPFSNEVQSMEYKYEGGVTPTLPATFASYGDSRDPSGRGVEFYMGSPGVTYSKVTTSMNGSNKVVHHFLTAKDLPIQIIQPTIPASVTDGTKYSRASVIDFSALWGQLWKREELGDEDGRVIRSSRTYWNTNFAALPINAEDVTQRLPDATMLTPYPENSSGLNISAMPDDNAKIQYFGMSQSLFSHRYFVGSGCYADDGSGGPDCPQSNIVATQMNFKRMLPSVSLQETVVDGLSNKVYSYYYDYRTGTPLKTMVANSDNSLYVTQVKPAYYQYEPMLEKNMLDQPFSSSRFHYPPDNVYSMVDGENPARGIGAELTIWRPVSRQGLIGGLLSMDTELQAFRISRNLSWRTDLNSARPNLEIPMDGCTIGPGPSRIINCDGVDNGGPGPLWQLTRKVNRYDTYGHPIDETDQSGINHTTLYGHRKSLPVAFVRNSPPPSPTLDGKFQALQESFESKEDVQGKLIYTPENRYAISRENSRTGAHSLEVKNATGGMVCLSLGHLEPNTAYEASAWYFDATDGSSTSDPSATRPGIFIGESGGCAMENHPNGVSGSPPSPPGSWNFADRATGSKQWKRIKASITSSQCPDGAQLDPAIVCVYASKGGTGRPVLYDELRVKAAGSQMTSYAYDAKGRMISVADIRETVTSFEYDGVGNLMGIRNDDGKLVSEQGKKFGKNTISGLP